MSVPPPDYVLPGFELRRSWPEGADPESDAQMMSETFGPDRKKIRTYYGPHRPMIEDAAIFAHRQQFQAAFWKVF